MRTLPASRRRLRQSLRTRVRRCTPTFASSQLAPAPVDSRPRSRFAGARPRRLSVYCLEVLVCPRIASGVPTSAAKTSLSLLGASYARATVVARSHILRVRAAVGRQLKRVVDAQSSLAACAPPQLPRGPCRCAHPISVRTSALCCRRSLCARVSRIGDRFKTSSQQSLTWQCLRMCLQESPVHMCWLSPEPFDVL